MRLRSFKLMSVLLAVFIALSLSSGCAKKASVSETTNATTTTQTTAKSTSIAEETNIYPIKTDVTLTMWMVLNSYISANFENYSDTEFSKAREKATGIKVEYIHPENSDAMNVLIASGELPDIIQYALGYSYPGGFSAAYNNGIIIALDEVKEYAPNFFNFLNDNPEIAAMTASPEGLQLQFPYINKAAPSDYGPIIKKHWLDKVGLGIPETVDEWYEALKAFRDKLGATAPFTISYANELFDESRFLVCAFGISNDFFVRDGKVLFGPMQPEFKSYISTLAKWYKEGLIDKDYIQINRQTCNGHMIGSESGASANFTSYISFYNDEGRKTDPEYNVVPAPIVVKNKGDEPMLGYKRIAYDPTRDGAVITTQCKKRKSLQDF